MKKNAVVMNGEIHTIRCTVEFRGAYAPTISWTVPAGMCVIGGKTDTNVWSSVTFTVDDSLNGYTFESTTHFTTIGGDVPSDLATNIPAYRYPWKSLTLRVLKKE